MFELPKAEWVIYSAGMRQIHKWSIDGRGRKIEQTKKISLRKKE